MIAKDTNHNPSSEKETSRTRSGRVSQMWHYCHPQGHIILPTHPCMKTCSESKSHLVVSGSLWARGLYSPWNSPGQNTGVGSLSLLQRIFPTQGSNPGLPHCRWNLYQLSHKGSPRILEWVAYPFSRASSWPRNRTGVSWIARGFLALCIGSI